MGTAVDGLQAARSQRNVSGERRGSVLCKPSAGAQREALQQIGLRDRHAPKINSVPCRRGRVLRARGDRRIRPRSLPSMPPALTLHDGVARCGPHRQHRGGRAATACLRKLIATRKGRHSLRERVAVEHLLAHLGRKQGRRARYLGVRRNRYDARRAATVVNLETIHRLLAAAAQLLVIQTVCRSRRGLSRTRTPCSRLPTEGLGGWHHLVRHVWPQNMA